MVVGGILGELDPVQKALEFEAEPLVGGQEERGDLGVQRLRVGSILDPADKGPPYFRPARSQVRTLLSTAGQVTIPQGLAFFGREGPRNGKNAAEVFVSAKR